MGFVLGLGIILIAVIALALWLSRDPDAETRAERIQRRLNGC